jgi:hypothetical protein
MSSHFRTNLFKIDSYFTELKNKIDLPVEIYIQANQHDSVRVDEINRVREEWIAEIDKCQEHNLAELKKNKDNHMLLEDENLFKRFCFIIQFYGDTLSTGRLTWRFFSTDTYLRPGQIVCFESMLSLNFQTNISDDFEILCRQKNNFQNLKRLFISDNV